jgi:3',5'-cyclic AMP phosphodiesterase CpdA
MATNRSISPSVMSLLVVVSTMAVAQDEPDFPFYNLRPYLQSLTSTSVLIASQSKEEVIARLQYGPDTDMALTIEESVPGRDHLFRVEGLEPAKTYYYRVNHVGVTRFATATFRTLGGPGSETVVATIGDSGSGTDDQLRMADLLADAAPQILLHTGDTVYPYGTPRWYYERFFKVYQGMLASTCIYPSLGNHDCYVSPDYWLYIFHLPANNPASDESYYSFDAGDAHFVALNSCWGDESDGGKVPEDQVSWLDQDLAATKQIWKIVYFHHAPYSNGMHGGNVRVRAEVSPVCERRGVDLVLSGHDHVYERSYPILENKLRDGYQDPNYVSPHGIIYVVTGGAGGTLYDYHASPDAHLSAVFHSKHNYVSLKITPEEIEGRAIDLEGSELDRFTIRKTGTPTLLRFLRADSNQDGTINLTDGVAILNFLFVGAVPPCLAACDVNGSSTVDITDAVHTLNFLFLGGPPPAPPFPSCDAADHADDTGCRTTCPAQN